MAPLPTASRIFADRFRRELKKKEADMAHKISPGTTRWGDAINVFFDRIGDAGSPVRRAALMRQLARYLNDNAEGGTHFILDCGGATRSYGLIFATLSAGCNPLQGVDEEGINIAKHFVLSRRNGAISAGCGVDIAFVSRHALGRLHERGHNLNDNKASCVLACVGILGLLTRDSSKHVDGGLALHYDDTLVVGSLRHAIVDFGEHRTNGTFFDVRTALPADEVMNQAMLKQGTCATIAVAKWLDDRSISKEFNNGLAETIPYLPRRKEDYTSLNAIVDTRSNRQ